ncbi:uncharacterized protein HD556DRAFT_1308177 [Suillus plorans]|uniref:Uncharacterized protein n=1 Tax=Suillus plorans TaxID=116603 RepID=A0A9P7DH47_9AGAM|nr:uncharacterized protein HD556DRAFT_1308177 [Suillus plorans]KAG1794098.1 hypothetical protein HD556DRAFT_1308177 [Suillus plorans]
MATKDINVPLLGLSFVQIFPILDRGALFPSNGLMNGGYTLLHLEGKLEPVIPSIYDYHVMRPPPFHLQVSLVLSLLTSLYIGTYLSCAIIEDRRDSDLYFGGRYLHRAVIRPVSIQAENTQFYTYVSSTHQYLRLDEFGDGFLPRLSTTRREHHLGGEKQYMLHLVQPAAATYHVAISNPNPSSDGTPVQHIGSARWFFCVSQGALFATTYLRDKTSAEYPKAKEPAVDPKGKCKANAPGGSGFPAKGSGTQQNLALVDTDCVSLRAIVSIHQTYTVDTFNCSRAILESSIVLNSWNITLIGYYHFKYCGR